MRTVVDKHTVAHLWANQEQDRARTPSGNLFFEYDIIYSYGYHFVIGRHVENATGQRAVLLTKREYSKTTKAQITIVRQASNHIKQLVVPDTNESSESLYEKWYDEIKSIASHLPKARKPEIYILQIQRVFLEAKKYADFFNEELPLFLREAGFVQSHDDYDELVKNEIAIKAVQEKKKRILARKLQQIRLKKWRTFKTKYITTNDGFDYLRYNHSAQRVETSQNVEIPTLIAQQFYALIQEILAKGGCSDCQLLLMGRFNISEINKSFIMVGCHKISIKEIRSFVKKNGWQNPTQTATEQEYSEN